MVDADAHMETYFGLARRQGEPVIGFLNQEDNEYLVFRHTVMRMIREYLKRKGRIGHVFGGDTTPRSATGGGRRPATSPPPMEGHWVRARGARGTPPAETSIEWEVPLRSEDGAERRDDLGDDVEGGDMYFAAFLEILRGWRLVKAWLTPG